MRYCGVWTATEYWMPFLGSSQKLGAVCPLDDSEMSMSLAMSRWVRPSELAASRSTLTRSWGVAVTWLSRTSTIPGTSRISRSSLRIKARLATVLVGGPITCTSIGAEMPKLSTCVERSGARKKKVASGKRCVSSRRSVRTCSSVGP
ncbi:MAG: hypothetical protein RLZZ450_4699 [Pseudomonadota bacterium]